MKNENKTLDEYHEAAKQGDASSQNHLGAVYYCGKDVEKNESKALYWFGLAAKQNFAAAQYNLGVMYSNEKGIKKDKQKAADWFELAANQGVAKAQYNLGLMYYNGEGVIENQRTAAHWFQAAADQGHAGAQGKLSWMYCYGEGFDKEDDREGYIWYLITKASGGAKIIELLQMLPWPLTSAEKESAKREATQRFEEIKSRKSNTQNFDRVFAAEDEEFTIALLSEPAISGTIVFESTWPSIVMIEINGKFSGSGVIIESNLVATNCHVLKKRGEITVYKPENQRIKKDTPFSARVVHRNEKRDFCVLEVNGIQGIPAKIRRYSTLKVGENVYALGAPLEMDMTLSTGIISRLPDGDIQTNAAISHGSSGGGLFDADSNFIGIMTEKFIGSGTSGIGFAIPADLALKF